MVTRIKQNDRKIDSAENRSNNDSDDEKECQGEEGGENKEVLLDLVVVEVAIGAAIIVVVAIAKEGEDTNAVKR